MAKQTQNMKAEVPCIIHSSILKDHRAEYFGEGTGPIYLSSLNCHGSEANLLECVTHARATGVHDCSHLNDAGVHCQGNNYRSGTDCAGKFLLLTEKTLRLLLSCGC